MSISVRCIGRMQISPAGWFPTNLIHAKILTAVQTKEDMIETTMYEYHDSLNKPHHVLLESHVLKNATFSIKHEEKQKT